MSKVVVDEKKLKKMIRETVTETLQEILRDPDFNMELQDWVKERLEREPEQLIPFEEVKKELE